MLKVFLISAIFICAVTAVNCSRNPESYLENGNLVLYYGQSFTIESEKITVGFDSVLTESRCPSDPDIRCFWQGMAEIHLWLLKPGQDKIYITLGIEGLGEYPDKDNFPPVDTLGLSFKLIKLNPYPVGTGPYRQSNYVATIRIDSQTVISEPDGIVRIVDINPQDIMLDAFDLNSAEISGDILELSVGYGGGCQKHYFFIYMSPDSFMESDPVQVDLFLQHYANNDMCEAYITRPLRFDLTPIAELYRNIYSPGGDIVVNVYEYFEDTPGGKIGVPYHIAYPPD